MPAKENLVDVNNSGEITVNSESPRIRNRAFIWAGLGFSLLIAVVLSPFASKHPDGLDRVSEDQKFADRAVEVATAQQLPPAQVFDEYAVKGVPDALATPLAGLVGTLVTFGLAWGAGKLLIRQRHDIPPELLPEDDSAP